MHWQTLFGFTEELAAHTMLTRLLLIWLISTKISFLFKFWSSEEWNFQFYKGLSDLNFPKSPFLFVLLFPFFCWWVKNVLEFKRLLFNSALLNIYKQHCFCSDKYFACTELFSIIILVCMNTKSWFQSYWISYNFFNRYT